MTYRNCVAMLVVAASLAACGSAEDRADKYLARAQASFEAEDYVKAGLDVKNTLKIDPDNVEARFLLAEINEKNQNWGPMLGNLRRVVELDEGHIEARVKLGTVYLMANQVDQASEQIEAVLELDPRNPSGRVLRASMMRRTGDVDGAVAEASGVLVEHPDNVAAVSLLASVSATDDPDHALAILEEGIGNAPDAAALRLLKIGLLEREERWDDVEVALKQMIDAFPEQKVMRYRLARFYTLRERDDEAERVLSDMMASYPDDITAKRQFAQFLANKRSPEVAEEAIKGFIADEPEVYEFRFDLARLYELTSRRGEAEDTYLQVIELDGTDASGLEARNKLAALYLRSRSLDKARPLVEEVLVETPSNSEALLMRAGLTFDEGNMERAIADLRTVLRNVPNSERALIMLGQAHLRNGDTNLAEENFRKLVSAHPGNAQGRLSLARLLIAREEWDDARALLEGVLQANPGDVGTRRMLVDVLIRAEDWPAALENAVLLTGDSESEALGHYLQGRVHQAQREFELAVPEYRAALGFQSNSIEALSGLVGSLVALDRAEEAIEYLEGYSTENPASFHAHTLLGEVHARMQRWDLSKAGFEQAIALNPTWLPAYRALAGVNLQQDDLEGAIEICQRGLEALPESNDMRLLLAGVYERAERFDDAVTLYEEVLDRDDSSDVAANNLAALIADYQSDQPERLERALSVARRFENSQNALFLDTLGWVHYQLGNLDQALPLLEEAVQRNEGRIPQLRYHLGMAYYETDRRDLAKRELQAAVDNSDADFVGLERARETLARL